MPNALAGAPLLALLLIPLFAAADRAWGMARPAWAERLPVKAMIVAALGAGAFLLAGRFGAISALAWLIWRSPGWDIFGGSAAPRGLTEFLGTVLRHLIAVPLLILAAYWTDHSVLLALGAGLGFVTVATALAEWLGHRVDVARDEHRAIGAENTILELARGGTFGLAVALVSLV